MVDVYNVIELIIDDIKIGEHGLISSRMEVEDDNCYPMMLIECFAGGQKHLYLAWDGELSLGAIFPMNYEFKLLGNLNDPESIPAIKGFLNEYFGA